MPPELHIISLGAGVQSSTMALMAAKGEITPMPDAAVFADTQSEPPYVYEWLERLRKLLPFEIKTGTQGNLEKDILGSLNDPERKRVGQAPFFVTSSLTEEAALLWRKCTKEYKVAVIRRVCRQFMDEKGANSIVQSIGISLDESWRMKPSTALYIKHRYPLIDLRMTRHDCVLWLTKNGYPIPPKSACWFCPYTDNSRWREMKALHPELFDRAAKFDSRIRKGIPGVKGEAYLHRSLKPLAEVDFRSEEDKGQLNMFVNECEGMCGV